MRHLVQHGIADGRVMAKGRNGVLKSLTMRERDLG